MNHMPVQVAAVSHRIDLFSEVHGFIFHHIPRYKSRISSRYCKILSESSHENTTVNVVTQRKCRPSINVVANQKVTYQNA